MRVNPLNVHASLVSPFVRFKALGTGRVERDLEKSGLPIIDYEGSNSSVAEGALCRFVSRCAEENPNIEFGLQAAKSTGIQPCSNLDLVDSHMSVWSVLNQICDHKNRFSPYPYYWLKRDGGISWICRGPHIAPFDLRDIELFAVHRLIDVIRVLTGHNFIPSNIRLKTSGVGNIRCYSLLENASLEFNSSYTSIAVPHEILMGPSRTVGGDEFIASVRMHLDAARLSYRLPNIENVSESLGISRRNLQRFLHGRDTSFRILHDEFVFKTVREIWQQQDATVKEVALELGYSNHASFSRAISRIVGTTPTSFRTHVRSEVKTAQSVIGNPDMNPQPNRENLSSFLAVSQASKGNQARPTKTPRNFKLTDLNFSDSARAGFNFKSTWLLNFAA